jgi:hypothetical protein
MMQRYEARELAPVHSTPGVWNGGRIGVFRVTEGKEELLGEYKRNYTTLFRTFFPFQAEGMDLALYSPSYTATRILALPECVDLGGEASASLGFCPVEFFVPTYAEIESVTNGDAPLQYRKNNPKPETLVPKHSVTEHTDPLTGEVKTTERTSRVVTPLTYYPFGFVAGCVWGDDSTWKIQYLDLSRAAEGILKRDERFGYIELPEGLKLAEAVDMTDYLYDPEEEDAYVIAFALHCRFDVRTGKPRDRWGEVG